MSERSAGPMSRAFDIQRALEPSICRDVRFTADARKVKLDLADAEAIVAELAQLRAELTWRREVMGAAKDALSVGSVDAAWETLTDHEQEGYPWAPGAPSNRGPDAAHDFLRARRSEGLREGASSREPDSTITRRQDRHDPRSADATGRDDR